MLKKAWALVSKNVWTRWEPDGTFHLQVKPSGGSGGNAWVKINPNGDVYVTSEKGNITIDAKNTLTIKANRMSVDVPKTSWKGDIGQTGTLAATLQTNCRCP
jgi:hypothetical protein